ncbi:MAG: cell wall hydrolase [Actinobacteria bacterium]|nr:cell wall hydrolase [Actinomycetota bacterium]
MSTSFTRAASVIGLLAVLWICVMGAASGEEKVECTGQTPENKEIVYYTVQKGDTLCGIAESSGSHLETILKANRISNTIIHPGQVLLIPGREPDYEMALSRGFSREDVLLLARAIHAEARGETFTGQVAVGAVIVNRIKSGHFPRTVREVIMQNREGTYQFTPVQDGSINLNPDDTAVYAAIQAIAGQDPTSGALYFYNPETATDRWIRSLPVAARIGNHVFAKRS